MGKILQRLMMLLGLLLYLFDYGSDIYVANKYWQNGDVWWFGLTVGFIVGPSITVNITAIIQLINYWSCLAAVLQLSIVVRYLEAIKSPKSGRVHSLARLRYLETIIESAPQWCLQGYIMLRQWKFPTYTVVSIVLSLLSLTWSITSLEKARREDEGNEFNICHGLLFTIIQLCTLIPRLSGIVIFAYVFRYYVFIFIAIHWVIQTAVVFKLQQHHTTVSFILSLMTSLPYLFHASKAVISLRRPKHVLVIGYIFIVLGTVAMVTLSLTIKMPDVPHMDELKPIVIGLTAGGLFSASICLWCFYSCLNDDDDDDDGLEPDIPAWYIHGRNEQHSF